MPYEVSRFCPSCEQIDLNHEQRNHWWFEKPPSFAIHGTSFLSLHGTVRGFMDAFLCHLQEGNA